MLSPPHYHPGHSSSALHAAGPPPTHHNLYTHQHQPHPPPSTAMPRDLFTPSPTSSESPSSYDGSSPLYAPYTFPPPPPAPPSSRREARRLSEPACLDASALSRSHIAHPYARLYNKKNTAGKRRKMWNHALEKILFTPQEISTMGAPHRRTIYTASLEAHIDRLHDQLASYSLAPVPPEKLDPYRGLNAKTAKSMVSGLHHDGVEQKLKILEIERANKELEEKLASQYRSSYC